MIRQHLVLVLLVVAGFALSLMAGKLWIAPNVWMGAGRDGAILLELRLPRALLGLGIGGGAGAVISTSLILTSGGIARMHSAV